MNRTQIDPRGASVARVESDDLHRPTSWRMVPPTRSERPHRLPTPLTSFVARDREVAEIARLLERERLVTLFGGPGFGKTRLALRVAADLVDRLTNGVRLVDLSGLADSTLVPAAVARALRVRQVGRRPLLDTLAELLRDDEILLVLDNCEHLLDECAALADRLLGACAGLRILATSREPLRLIGEVSWPVPPLSVPKIDDWPSRKSSGPRVQTDPRTAVLDSEAGRLFLDRARSVRRSFELTDASAADVARICRQLDGIPLAIELAAARVRVLAPADVAARLEDPLSLLTGGSRAALPRQRTLRGLIDWSYRLLTEEERVLFKRLAVFVGGWTLEVAEGVCRVENVMDVLSRLVDKSLVAVEPRGETVRYRLLDTIRQYAGEAMREAEEIAQVRDWHLDFFVGLAEQADLELQGPRQAEWLIELDAEHDNLLAALGWARASEDQGRGVRLARGLWRFWLARGLLEEGRYWLGEFLAEHQPGVEDALRADSLSRVGGLSQAQGDLEAARVFLDEAVAIGRRLGDGPVSAGALTQRGHLARLEGDIEHARGLYEESLAMRERLGERLGMAWSLGGLGHLARQVGEFDRAQTLYEQALALNREAGHEWQSGVIVWHLGELAYDRRLFNDARAYYRECLAALRGLADPRGTAASLEGLAAVEIATTDPERGLRLVGVAQATRCGADAPLTLAERRLLDRRLEAGVRALGAERTAELLKEGAAMDPERVVVEILAEEPRGVSDTSWQPSLTARDREVIGLLARGYTNRQIADALVISERTAEWRVGTLRSRLSVHTRAEVAVWAIQRGLAPDESSARV